MQFPKPKYQKSKYKRAVKLLDDIFSNYIRYRDGRKFRGMCAICRIRPIFCCFHFFPRKNMATRFEPDAACASCKGCNFDEHMRRGTVKGDTLYREAHVRLVGEQRRQELEVLKSQTFKKSTEEILEMIQELEDRLGKVAARFQKGGL